MVLLVFEDSKDLWARAPVQQYLGRCRVVVRALQTSGRARLCSSISSSS
jgi:hypothetical protein